MTHPDPTELTQPVSRNVHGWQPIETAPKDGTIVNCLWPGYGNAGQLHEGYCVYKRDWYSLGGRELELWWTGANFKNPTAKDPTHWMPLPAPPVMP